MLCSQEARKNGVFCLRVNYRIKVSDHCIKLYTKWFSSMSNINRQQLEFCWSISPNVSLSDVRIDG